MKALLSHQFLCAVLFVTALSSTAPPQNKSPDEIALIAQISSYYAAYSKKDLGALLMFWSHRSPDLPAGIEEAQHALVGGVYGVSEVSVAQIKIAEDKAILQVSAVFASSDEQARARRREKRVRNFALIKEGGEWKIWRDADSAQDLSAFLEKGSEWRVSADSIEQFAITLVNASGAERDHLLADNQKMITTDLRNALTRKVGPLKVPGSYDRAVSLLRLIEKIAERLGEKETIAMAERQIGDVFREWGRWAEALEHYQEAAAIYESMGRRSSMAATITSIGHVYFAQKNYKLAIESYQKALAEFESLRNSRAIADTLEELASVYYDQEIYDRALDFFERCLKLRETFAGKGEIASTLNSIGNVYFQQMEYDWAIPRYKEALAIFEALKDQGLTDLDAVVSTLSNLGSVTYAQGNADIALDYYHRALNLQDKLRDRHVAANLRLNIATAYASQGNYSPAIDNLEKAADIFEALRDKNQTARALSDIGEAYFHLQNYNAALDQYQRSLTLYEQLNSLADTSMRIYAIGNVYFALGDFDLAIESYKKALAQFEAIKYQPGIASLLASIAGTHYAQQQYDIALDFYQQSLAKYQASSDPARAAVVTERIGSVYYSQGDFTHSLEWVARALSVAEHIGSLETVWRARLTEGLAHRALNQADQAQQSFEQSIAAIESMNRKLVRGENDAQQFFQTRNAAYLSMMELLVAQNKVPEAFAYAERARMNTMLDIFQRAAITKTLSLSETEEERMVHSAVVAAKARISRERERKRADPQLLDDIEGRLLKALNDYRKFETALYAAHPKLKMLRAEGAPISLEEASRLVPDSETVLLQFVVADTKTYLFVLTRSFGQRSPGARVRPSAYVLNAYVIGIGRAQLAERLSKFRELIARRDEGVQSAGRELYDLLLAPASGQLTGKAHWLIVPDDALWKMPFAALRSPENRYLVEDHAIAYAPSVTALREMTKRFSARSSAPSLLAFGNPVISSQTAERVKLVSIAVDSSPDSETEVKSLERLYTAARSKAFVGAQASESVAKQQSGRYGRIHFAAPALLNDASPLYSHIALAQSEGNGNDDGLLEVSELMRMDLRIDLLTLSTSQPAQERMSSGESYIGWSWGLFVAGCPTTVLSQWRVKSPSTTDLMLEFHQNLKSHDSDTAAGSSNKSRKAVEARQSRFAINAAQALQGAMLKMLSGRYRHPYYWAGFEVIGR